MERIEFDKLYDKFIDKSSKILKSKSKDYAGQDVLANFKRVTTIASQYRFDFSSLPEYALFMACMKIDRLLNLAKSNSVPSNESVEDSYIDLINYCMLSYACYEEEQKRKNAQDDQ